MSLICPICHDNLVGESVDSFVNKCGHVYHTACLMPWWDQARGTDPTCPECRQPCNMNTIQKIYFTLDPSDNDGAAALQPTDASDDVAQQALLRQIKEYITLQTCDQTKDINDKFRAQNTEFSSLLLNSTLRMAKGYDEKLTTVSKELTEVISNENHRLLSKLAGDDAAGSSRGTPPRKSNAVGFNGDDVDGLVDTPNSSFNYKRITQSQCTGNRLNWIAITIAFLCLIAVIGYSHFILNAVAKTEYAGSEKTLNVSKSLQQLSNDMENMVGTINQNQRDITNKWSVLHNLLRAGINTNDVTNRLGELTGKIDKLLLEQLQTDRQTDYKLNVLQNEISMVREQIDAGLRKNVTDASAHQRDLALAQLKQANDELQAKLQRLQRIVANEKNTSTAQVRDIIVQDPLLSPHSQRQPKSFWDKVTGSVDDWMTSGGGDVSVHVALIMTATLAAMILQMLRD